MNSLYNVSMESSEAGDETTGHLAKKPRMGSFHLNDCKVNSKHARIHNLIYQMSHMLNRVENLILFGGDTIQHEETNSRYTGSHHYRVVRTDSLMLKTDDFASCNKTIAFKKIFGPTFEPNNKNSVVRVRNKRKAPEDEATRSFLKPYYRKIEQPKWQLERMDED